VLGFAAALAAWTSAPPSAGQASRVYVRRIEFVGVARIDDEVLRRELVQLEGTYLNTVALDRSLARLERLPYIASADASLEPVDGNLELVDVEIRIVEAPARRYGVGGAYSGALRGRLHGYFINENVLGTGQRLELRAEGNELFFSGLVSHTDPHARLTGVSRTIGLASRRIDQLTVDASSLDTDVDSARLEYAYRVAVPDEAAPDSLDRLKTALEIPRDMQRLSFGIELGAVDVAAGPTSSEQLRGWVAAADDGAFAAGTPSAASFTTADFLLHWRNDTRDSGAFPTGGRRQVLSLRSSLPGTDVSYYWIDYDATRYWGLGARWTATLATRLGVGGVFGDLPSLPPYMNWLAGGPATVRGYRDGTLGPRDSGGRPYGGDLLVAAQAEWLTPWPRRWQERVRTGFFYDVGNVYYRGDAAFFDERGAPLDYSFDASELRQSIGLVARFRIPLGVLSLSYALPLDASTSASSVFRRDDVERLQLTVGVDF
jgi:outer membrane protein insertion porin family